MNVSDFEKMSINCKTRSAWSRGVAIYMTELRQQIITHAKYLKCEITTTNIRELALNGTITWDEFSYSGSTLIYDYDIARRLCSPSELKRTDYGRLRPNARENWLDVQTRALMQAYNLLSMEFWKKERGYL